MVLAGKRGGGEGGGDIGSFCYIRSILANSHAKGLEGKIRKTKPIWLKTKSILFCLSNFL